MTRLKKKYQGQHTNRFDREPLEKKFALAWQRHNSTNGTGPDVVDDLSTTSFAAFNLRSSNEERGAINTTIQWLGSPVGFTWLMETLGIKGVRSEADLKDLKEAWRGYQLDKKLFM